MHISPIRSVVDSFKAVIAGEAEGRQAFIVFIAILLIAAVIWLIILIYSPAHSDYYINS